ncbi:MAG: hypothetical protein ACRCVX_00570, partial [Shewanella sp.]
DETPLAAIANTSAQTTENQRVIEQKAANSSKANELLYANAFAYASRSDLDPGVKSQFIDQIINTLPEEQREGFMALKYIADPNAAKMATAQAEAAQGQAIGVGLANQAQVIQNDLMRFNLTKEQTTQASQEIMNAVNLGIAPSMPEAQQALAGRITTETGKQVTVGSPEYKAYLGSAAKNVTKTNELGLKNLEFDTILKDKSISLADLTYEDMAQNIQIKWEQHLQNTAEGKEQLQLLKAQVASTNITVSDQEAASIMTAASTGYTGNLTKNQQAALGVYIGHEPGSEGYIKYLSDRQQGLQTMMDNQVKLDNIGLESARLNLTGQELQNTAQAFANSREQVLAKQFDVSTSQTYLQQAIELGDKSEIQKLLAAKENPELFPNYAGIVANYTPEQLQQAYDVAVSQSELSSANRQAGLERAKAEMVVSRTASLETLSNYYSPQDLDAMMTNGELKNFGLSPSEFNSVKQQASRRSTLERWQMDEANPERQRAVMMFDVLMKSPQSAEGAAALLAQGGSVDGMLAQMGMSDPSAVASSKQALQAIWAVGADQRALEVAQATLNLELTKAQISSTNAMAAQRSSGGGGGSKEMLDGLKFQLDASEALAQNL